MLGAKTICGRFVVDLCRFALNENLFVNGSSGRTYIPDFRRPVIDGLCENRAHA